MDGLNHVCRLSRSDQGCYEFSGLLLVYHKRTKRDYRSGPPWSDKGVSGRRGHNSVALWTIKGWRKVDRISPILTVTQVTPWRPSFQLISTDPIIGGCLRIDNFWPPPNHSSARTYLQLPLRQWGAGNVYLLVLFS